MSENTGHWYCPKTNSAKHTLVGANKKERGTTLADAKKLGLVPSVSGIIGLLDKPALVNWYITQTLNACIEWPYTTDIPEADWRAGIQKLSSRVQRQAADDGRIVHGYLEDHFKDGAEPHERILNVLELLKEKFPNAKWESEQVFTHGGYGGTCDMLCRQGNGIILDFKTKNTSDVKKMKGYDSHIMQLAAYRMGLGVPKAKCYNLFISTDPSSNALVLQEWSEAETKRAEKMFLLLVELWYLMKNVKREK